MSVKVEMSAFQEGILRLLAAEIQEWNLEEVLTVTESLRIRLGLKSEQLQAAICGPFEVVIIIAGGVADRDTVFDAKERAEVGQQADAQADTAAAIDDAMAAAASLGTKPATPAAHDFLYAGIKHMEDRAAEYDSPEGERSMAATVEAFNAITGCDLNEVEGWLFMGVLKMVRSQQGGPFKADTYEDWSAFGGLAGEAAARRQRQVDAGLGEFV